MNGTKEYQEQKKRIEIGHDKNMDRMSAMKHRHGSADVVGAAEFLRSWAISAPPYLHLLDLHHLLLASDGEDHALLPTRSSSQNQWTPSLPLDPASSG